MHSWQAWVHCDQSLALASCDLHTSLLLPLKYCLLQTPISILQRIRKDGASVLKETLSKTKLWVPGTPSLLQLALADQLSSPATKLLMSFAVQARIRCSHTDR